MEIQEVNQQAKQIQGLLHIDYRHTNLKCKKKERCCDLIFCANLELVLNLEYLYIILGVTHANATKRL